MVPNDALLLRRPPETTIHSVLDALEQEWPRDPLSIFFRTAVNRGDPVATWKPAHDAYRRLTSQASLGSKAKRAHLATIARHPRLLSAVQAVVVGANEVRAEFLAVLIIDRGEASMDALVAHHDSALLREVRSTFLP